jgi:GAF domain-containing protein
MLVAGEKQGVLGVFALDERRVFTDADADVLEAFAGLASVALRNAAAFEQSARQARVQRGFYRIAAALAEPLSLQETLGALAQSARDALGGAYAAAVATESGGLRIVGPANVPEPLVELFERASPELAPVLHEAADTGRPIAAPALARDDRFEPEWRAAAAEAGDDALLTTPHIDLSEDVFPESPQMQGGGAAADEEPPTGDPDLEPEQGDDSITADQVAPEEQGPGDSEGSPPEPPPETE